jgi:hypothetical protein
MTSGTPDRNDERFVLGDWFDSVAAAVQAYPFRAGTEAAKIIHYDRSTVSKLASAFNAAAKGSRPMSRLDQASAGRHIYTMGKHADWGRADGDDVDGAAKDLSQDILRPAGTSSADYMHERMKRLYQTCKKNGVGVVVHTPKPGLIQISLAPQTRPTLRPAPRPRKKTLEI